jgi:hypothetical protein
MKDADKLARDVCRPLVERHFRDHPLYDLIMQAYDRGTVPPEQWDLWFGDMEVVAWERLKNLTNRDNGDGTFTFEMHKEPRT